MSIIAVRLLERNPKKGHKLRTYTSARGTKYTAGNEVVPSPFRVVSNRGEIKELREMDQFEVREFTNIDELRELATIEMEERARKGGSTVRAAIEGVADDAPAKPVKKPGSILSPTKPTAELRPTPTTAAAPEEPEEPEPPPAKPKKATGKKATGKKTTGKKTTGRGKKRR